MILPRKNQIDILLPTGLQKTKCLKIILIEEMKHLYKEKNFKTVKKGIEEGNRRWKKKNTHAHELPE